MTFLDLVMVIRCVISVILFRIPLILICSILKSLGLGVVGLWVGSLSDEEVEALKE